MANRDTHGSNEEEWVGFDLDGTLAKYDGWKGVEHIGKPVPAMVVLAYMLHKFGRKVKILTARVAPRDGDDGSKARKYVQEWCRDYLGFVPEVTHLKDASMVALFDDRACAVEQNTGKVLGGWPDFLPEPSKKAQKAILGKMPESEKKADAHHPDFDDIVGLYKDRYGIDLSHVRMKWSKHPRYRNGKRSFEFPDDESAGSHGPGIVWINPDQRSVMKRFGVEGKVKDFRRLIMAHELAHEVDTVLHKRRFVKKMLAEARKANFNSAYLDTVSAHKFDKELFAEWMAKKLSEPAEKKAAAKLVRVKKPLTIHDRLVRCVMRRNPGFTTEEAEKYISDGRLDAELAKMR